MKQGFTPDTLGKFLTNLRPFYGQKYRDMPWRRPECNGSFDAYKILVSEIMLQQTQVSRVTPKYEAFIQAFPDAEALAKAEFAEVLKRWSGLGYNRRARYLLEAAQALYRTPQPWSQDLLMAQKGIGPNTAAAVVAYAYNEPVLFVETNIRTVLFHYFFMDASSVTDKQLLQVLAQIVPWKSNMPTKTLRTDEDESPRRFYWAMMDLGSFLKRTNLGLNAKSRHYIKQSTFKGSPRELRGKVLKVLLSGPVSINRLNKELSDERFKDVVEVLIEEKLVTLQGKKLMLYNERSEI